MQKIISLLVSVIENSLKVIRKYIGGGGRGGYDNLNFKMSIYQIGRYYTYATSNYNC